MTYTSYLNIDLNASEPFQVVYAKQNDVNSRIIHVTFYSDGVRYNIASNHSVLLRIRKPDRKVILDGALVNADGTVSVILTQQCLGAAGDAYADLVEYDNYGLMLSTCSFIIKIQASPNIFTEDMFSSNEFLYLKELVDSANAIIREVEDYSKDSEAWAKGTRDGQAVSSSDPTYQNNSKYYADQATTNTKNYLQQKVIFSYNSDNGILSVTMED